MQVHRLPCRSHRASAGRQLAAAQCHAMLRLIDCHQHLQDSHGVTRWRSLKVYKLDDVFQIVTDLQKRLDEKHEAEADR